LYKRRKYGTLNFNGRNTGHDVELKQKAVDWKTKLDRLNELGE
jgi:hypothetical protein